MDQPNVNESLAVLKSVLGSRVVSYQPVFAKALRSVPAAVMLSQGYFWQQNATFKDLVEIEGRMFFTKTISDWYDATGMTAEQQSTAREALKLTGFWIEKKAGLPAKLYFHIDLDALVSGISGYLNTGIPVTGKIRSQSAHNQRNIEGRYVSGNPGDKFPETPDNCFRKPRRQVSGNPGNIGSGNPGNNIIKVESLESFIESVERENGDARAEKKLAVEIVETAAPASGNFDAELFSKEASPGRGAAPSNPSPGSAAPLPFAASPWAGVTPAEWADKLLPLCDDLPGNLDTAYYLGRCRDWSAEKGGKSADWLATAARFAHDDFRRNKLATIKPFSYDTNTGNGNTGNSNGGIDIARALARAERICRRNGDIP